MQCSLAMVLGRDIREILAIFPEKNNFFGPEQHRSPHIIEMIEAAYHFGYAMLTVRPKVLMGDGVQTLELPGPRTDWFNGRGIIDTRFKDGGRHFVAYEDSIIYNPTGFTTHVLDARYSHKYIHPVLEVKR